MSFIVCLGYCLLQVLWFLRPHSDSKRGSKAVVMILPSISIRCIMTIWMLQVSWPSQTDFLSVSPPMGPNSRILRVEMIEEFSGFRAVGSSTRSAMSCELALKTLQGAVITHKIDLDTTVGQLKAMLLENKTKDPIERKILRVELLQDFSIMKMDDAQDLGKTGLLEALALATVIYKRNEVEAATQAEVHLRGLFHLNIPPDLTTISGSAFQGCGNLVSVTITKSVTHIGNYAFFCCFFLARITLGDSMKHIGENAFRNCASLSSITLGDSVTHIGNNAFQNCGSLASITLGDSVRHIGDNAFQNCGSLASVTFGDSVTHIGDNAFQNCTPLSSITLGQSDTHIGKYAFEGCTMLHICKDWLCYLNPESAGIFDRAFSF